MLFIYYYFLFLHLAVPQGTAEARLGITALEYAWKFWKTEEFITLSD
jgi:hypothetical protein